MVQWLKCLLVSLLLLPYLKGSKSIPRVYTMTSTHACVSWGEIKKSTSYRAGDKERGPVYST